MLITKSLSFSKADASAADTAKTITQTANGSETIHVTAFEVSIKAAAGTGDITVDLKDGSTTLWSTVIGDAATRGTRVGMVCGEDPFVCSKGADANLVVSAGGASCVTVLSMKGFIR